MSRLKRNVARWTSALAVVCACVTGVFPTGAAADMPFPQTGASIWGPFEAYWKANGGLAQFGMPRTSVFPAREGHDAQWFERAMFTYTPANPDPYKVQLQLIGSIMTENRRNEAPFRRAAASGQGMFFEATGHNLSGKLLEFWRARGGLPIYGYPISEAFRERSKSDGNEYLVQYFERNRLEYHPALAGTPYEVQLGLLGSELLDLRGGPSAFAGLGVPHSYPAQAGAGANIPPGQVIGPPGTPGAGTPPEVPAAPALPVSSARILFASDFTSPHLSAWEQLAPLAPRGSSAASWRIASGRLEQVGVAREGGDDAAVIVAKGQSFGDFVMDSYLYATSGEPVGAVFRYSDTGFYLLRLYPGGAGGSDPKATLHRFVGGRGTEMAASTGWPGYTSAKWHHLSISAQGQSLTVRVDGQAALAARDATLSAGGVGFYAYADGTARFDNLRVTAPGALR